MGNKQCTYESPLIPLPAFGKDEMEWPNWLRSILYCVALGYTFLGVAIISDIFMAGIEKITSLKKRVRDEATGRTVTMHVWNATVANLTLMALGSSAPEILLSVIEITANEMYLGDLGAGTIVGSAAFNLLVISSVCVLAIPDGEVRYIKEIPVYAITSTFSVAAYLWVMVCLMVTSPNVVESWEAVLTLIFFPILVTLAYFADRGKLNWIFDSLHRVTGGNQKEEGGSKEDLRFQEVIPENVTKDELVQIEQQIRERHGAHITSEQVVGIMSTTYFTQRSRAYYRHAAMQQALGTKKVNASPVAPPDMSVSETLNTADGVEDERKCCYMGFACARYAFLENCGYATIFLERRGETNLKSSVRWKTRDGTAVAGADYEIADNYCIFEKGEVSKNIYVKIHDDNAYEENEEFYIDLSEPECDCTDGTVRAKLTEIPDVTVVIIDDDEPGFLRFLKEEVEVVEGTVELEAVVDVERFNGASGNISCKYHTEDMDAVAGIDYKEAKGVIELGPAIQNFQIPITIMPKGRFNKKSGFNVVLTDAVGCKFDKETDGAEECCICHVIIKGNNTEERMTLLQKMESRIISKQAKLGHAHWRQQFYNAFVINDDDDDEEGDDEEKRPSKFDIALHIISVPWKLLFATVPPVDYCGGWLCFGVSLGMIAVVTALVGDMARLAGCSMNINAEITAITLVALGTSLPDTFASKTAACMDPYADASIGNITGSNSVNVFLGLGLSWSIAAFYWEAVDAASDPKWYSSVFSDSGMYYNVRDDVQQIMSGGKAVFVVPAGSLWFNLIVFSINAFVAIQHLLARRRKFGGELGGPKKGFMGQYFSACFLVSQWFIYIIASSIFATVKDQ